MKDNSISGNEAFKAGDIIGGFVVERTAVLDEINAFYYRLLHRATGARHIHIANDDRENTFAVAFKTVPTDSTGVAHILEHTVLCGSRKFPVRDPFFSMIKRSLNTFMNAFTASDWTMYPFTTQNRKDYYNLMDVYLDAAFFPNIEELSFMQEGHRMELDPEDNLVYKGVVYNEMKGAMSSQDQVMVRSMLNALYPDTTYRFNSGGDPVVIPELTHEQLKAFHKRHYHPSNAFFYTYGNLPLADHLRVIEEKILNHFDAIDPRTDVPSQPRWEKPARVSYAYPLDPGEDHAGKCQVAVSWLMADIKDSFEVLSLVLLEQILLGNSASPLRKALIESGIGTALSDGTGFDADNRDTLFSCGLKGVDASSADQMEELVFKVLKDLSTNGVPREMIESAIHQIEFHRKEVTNTPYPYGIKLLLAISGGWFHGGDPEKILLFDADLKQIWEKLATEPFFENKIRQYFLHNNHRVRLLLKPDGTMAEEEKKRVQKELAAIRKKLNEEDIRIIREYTEKLAGLQDAEEDLSCLPTLSREDIPPDVPIVNESDAYAGTRTECYEQPTSGIFYFSAAAGAGGIEQDLIPLLPFYCSSFARVGTTDHDYTEMAQLIDMVTGGVGLSPQARTGFGANGESLPFVSFGGKCLVRNLAKMFSIIAELFGKVDFFNLNRLKNLLLEYQAGMESMIVNNGHRLAISLASRNFTTAAALGEMWNGVHQLKTIQGITGRFTGKQETEAALEKLAEDLTRIGKSLFRSANLRSAIVGDERMLSSAVGLVPSVYAAIPGGGADCFKTPELSIDSALPREGWTTSSAVSFVAGMFKTVRMHHPDAPVLSVISKMMRSLYLHKEIREKGGAYGGFAVYNSEDGLFGYASYRDPHILSTLNAFKGAAEFIRSGKYDEEDIKEAILQVCSEIDKPDTPGAAGRKAFFRKIISLSDETRIAFKKTLLETDRQKVMDAAERYFRYTDDQQAVSIISSQDKITEANRKLGDKKLSLHKI
ncbi:MAG: peptidase M16 [Desulfobacteraceae bacterium]|nr:MAG: peptidase M16 [Desulfobacteraceae bacterium]